MPKGRRLGFVLLACVASAPRVFAQSAPVRDEGELLAALRDARRGAVIRIHDGPITLCRTVRIRRGDFKLQGAGPASALVRRATGNDRKGSEFVVYVRPPINGTIENIAFENLTFDMTLDKNWNSSRVSPATGCLRVTSFNDRGVRGVAVRNCRFHMRSERGWDKVRVYVCRVGAQVTPKNHPDRLRIKDIYIEDNLFTDTAGQQIQVDECERARVRRNVVLDPGQGQWGRNTIFRVIAARDVVFEHNYLYNRAKNTAGAAIYVGGYGGMAAEDVIFRNNLIDTNAPGQAARFLSPLRNCRFIGDRLHTPGRTTLGLELTDGGNSGIDGLLIFNHVFDGFPTPFKSDAAQLNNVRIVGNAGGCGFDHSLEVRLAHSQEGRRRAAFRSAFQTAPQAGRPASSGDG